MKKFVYDITEEYQRYEKPKKNIAVDTNPLLRKRLFNTDNLSHFGQLPDELILIIFNFAIDRPVYDLTAIKNISLTCRRFYKLLCAKSDLANLLLWNKLIEDKFHVDMSLDNLHIIKLYESINIPKISRVRDHHYTWFNNDYIDIMCENYNCGMCARNAPKNAPNYIKLFNEFVMCNAYPDTFDTITHIDKSYNANIKWINMNEPNTDKMYNFIKNYNINFKFSKSSTDELYNIITSGDIKCDIQLYYYIVLYFVYGYYNIFNSFLTFYGTFEYNGIGLKFNYPDYDDMEILKDNMINFNLFINNIKSNAPSVFKTLYNLDKLYNLRYNVIIDVDRIMEDIRGGKLTIDDVRKFRLYGVQLDYNVIKYMFNYIHSQYVKYYDIFNIINNYNAGIHLHTLVSAYITYYANESVKKETTHNVHNVNRNYVNIHKIIHNYVNKITLPDDIKYLNYNNVHIAGNYLTNSINSFNKNIYKLTLVNTNLSEIPVELLEFKQLATLDLSNNKIKIVPEFMSNLKNLKTLDLHDNCIHHFYMKNITNITVLYLYNNQLTSFETIVGNLVKLYLHNNNIHDVILIKPGKEIVNINNLDLNNNKLVKIPNFVTKNISVDILLLCNNKIQSISPRIIKYYKKNTRNTVHMYGNYVKYTEKFPNNINFHNT